MKSWQLLILLAATHYGPDYFKQRWDVFTSMLGLMCMLLIWQIRGKRWSMMWLVSMWGVMESAQVFVCQGANIFYKVKADQFEGICEAMTGVPLYTLGLMCAAALAALWLDRQR